MPSDATFYGYLNGGVNPSAVRDAATYTYENGGLILPAQRLVSVPQIGWGSPMTPAEEVVLLVDSANPVAYSVLNTGAAGDLSSKDAVEYTYEGDVT